MNKKKNNRKETPLIVNQSLAEKLVYLEIQNGKNNANIVDWPYGNYSVEGLGPNAPTAKDGLQSTVNYRFDLMPPLATAKTASVLHMGAIKYGANSWLRLKDPNIHINHCLAHLVAYIAGDTQEGAPEDHIAHAVCRLLFALEVIEREKQNGSPLHVSGTGTIIDERI